MEEKLELTKWDPVERIKTPEDMTLYLNLALEENDPALVAAVLSDIARAQGMTKVAKDAGLTRESLYRALSKQGNPELGTILKVLKALGFKLHAEPLAS